MALNHYQPGMTFSPALVEHLLKFYDLLISFRTLPHASFMPVEMVTLQLLEFTGK